MCLDTNFAADLTIVEEASELLARIKGETDKAAAAVYKLLSGVGEVCRNLLP